MSERQTPETDAFTHAMYCIGAQSAAEGTTDISTEEAYGKACDLAKRLERQRDELAEALRDAMLDCDHMLLAYSNDPAIWFDDVRHAQSKMRALLARHDAEKS